MNNHATSSFHLKQRISLPYTKDYRCGFVRPLFERQLQESARNKAPSLIPHPYPPAPLTKPLCAARPIPLPPQTPRSSHLFHSHPFECRPFDISPLVTPLPYRTNIPTYRITHPGNHTQLLLYLPICIEPPEPAPPPPNPAQCPPPPAPTSPSAPASPAPTLRSVRRSLSQPKLGGWRRSRRGY